MKKNVGTLDKIVRIIIALIATYFAYTKDFSDAPWQGYLLWAVAIILLLTALTGSCPCYTLTGRSTCKVNYKNH